MDYLHVSADEGHTLHDEILRQLHALEEGRERVSPAVYLLTLKHLYRIICEEKVDYEGSLDCYAVGADVVPVRIEAQHLAVVCKVLGDTGLGVLRPAPKKSSEENQGVICAAKCAPGVQMTAIFDAEDGQENQGI